MQKDLIDDFYEYRQSVNRHTIGALLISDSVTNTVRRELRKLKPGIKVSSDEISDLIKHEVLKREILESESGIEALKQVTRFIRKQERAKTKTKASKPQLDSEKSDESNNNEH